MCFRLSLSLIGCALFVKSKVFKIDRRSVSLGVLCLLKTDFIFCKTDVQVATQTVAKKERGLLSFGLIFGLLPTSSIRSWSFNFLVFLAWPLVLACKISLTHMIVSGTAKRTRQKMIWIHS